MIYHLYDAFRYQGIIFLEHVLGIRYVLRCAEFHEPFSKALCERLHHPLVSTSANISGEPTARFFDEITPEILAQADYVCRYRRDDDVPCEPSSIIKINADGSFKIIRS